MTPPLVTVIYNQPVLPTDHPDAASEHDVIETAESIESILRKEGFRTSLVSFSDDPQKLINHLQEIKPDVVFNLFEGLATRSETEVSVASFLEWINIPYTGSPAHAISLGRDKIRTKYLLEGAGLPTPRFITIEDEQIPEWQYSWPAIVKPAFQDSSVGIEQASVVQSQKELENRVAVIQERYGLAVLIEEFIHGREFHVNLIEDPRQKKQGPTMIPLSEICFEYQADDHFWPIYSFDAKWNVETAEYLGTPLKTPVELKASWIRRIEQIALKTFKLIGLRDYGRLDVRVTEDGKPYILEVNPNPYINSIALLRGLVEMGRTHEQMVSGIVWNTLARSGKVSFPHSTRKSKRSKLVNPSPQPLN